MNKLNLDILLLLRLKRKLFLLFSLILGSFYFTLIADETEIENVEELEEFKVTVQKNPVHIPLPTVNVKISEDDLSNINIIDTEDAIKYAPNLFIRKRFIGDRNGVLSIRGASPFQNGRTLVFADGVTLSNIIETRWNGAPRWQIVAPDEIVRTEITFGPYSAQYSGHSMNGVVNIFTRQPAEQEFGASFTYFTQDYKEFGVDDTFNGFKTFLSYGDRVGKLSYYVFHNHLESDAQPQSAVSFAGNGIRAVAGGDTAVTGAFNDTNTLNQSRVIAGAVSFNEAEQDLYKFKTAYDFNEDMRMQFTLGYWKTSDDDVRVQNYVRDAVTGATIWSGALNFNGQAFDLAADDWAAENRDREDLLLGFTFEGTMANDWTYQALFTYFDIVKDQRRISAQNPLDPAFDGTGSVREMDGTNWSSIDAKFGKTEFMSNDSISFITGAHYSKYELNSIGFNSSDYNSGVKDLNRIDDDGGFTSITAVYGQADWDFNDQWTATLGLRGEIWNAEEGKLTGAGAPTFYDDRDESSISPKFSLSYIPDDKWKVRLSLARAVRYPVVSELFQSNTANRNTLVSNPDLQPEESFAKSIILERTTETQSIRLTYFHNDEEDTILRDRANQIGGGTRTEWVNLDEVLTQGIEFSVNKKNFLLDKFDLNVNVSYNNTEIKKNTTIAKALVGKEIPRVPEFRINMIATYHATENWDLTLSSRYADGAFDTLDNTDPNHDAYAGISKFFVADFKTSYNFDNGVSLAFGIDNLNNENYYMAHPFPQRTYHFSAKLKF